MKMFEPSVIRTYGKEVRKHILRFAVWPPHQAVRLGDYGVIVDGVFQRTGSLACPIVPRAGIQRAPEEPFVYASRGVVDVNIAGKGVVAVGGGASASGTLRIKFKKQRSVCVRLAGWMVEAIDNLDDVEHEILRMDDAKAWRSGRVVVTARDIVERATVLVSTAAGATADLRVVGQAPLDDLANASLRLGYKSSYDVGIKMVDLQCAPFCELRCLGGWFDREMRVKHMRSGEDELQSAAPRRLVAVPVAFW
jgi:hypothetical protein